MPGPGRPFPKGVSGNPGGRPKEVAEVRALAKEHSAMAVTTLADIAGDEQVDPRARVAAATALLDRGWGRPSQDIQVRAQVEAEVSETGPRPPTINHEQFRHDFEEFALRHGRLGECRPTSHPPNEGDSAN